MADLVADRTRTDQDRVGTGAELTTGAAVKRKRVVSGMRPTGRLHIGHYFGALANWGRLQNDPAYECFYFIADWHALTSDYADTSDVAQNTIEITTDYLAAGIDPEKSVIFQQSQVEEHAELHLLLSMVTPLSWLERVPTYKEQIENVTKQGFTYLRIFRLSMLTNVRHRHLQRIWRATICTGWRGSGVARRVEPRDRWALQFFLLAGRMRRAPNP